MMCEWASFLRHLYRDRRLSAEAARCASAIASQTATGGRGVALPSQQHHGRGNSHASRLCSAYKVQKTEDLRTCASRMTSPNSSAIRLWCVSIEWPQGCLGQFSPNLRISTQANL